MINKICIDNFDKTGFGDKFCVFYVEKTDDTNIVHDEIPVIYSASYVTKNNCYLLTPSSANEKLLYSVFPEQHYKIKRIAINELDPWHLITLLINKQANLSLSFNNLTATLYLITDSKRDCKQTISFSIDRNFVLSCQVKTFTLLNSKTLPKFTYKTQKAISDGKLTQYEIKDPFVCRLLKKRDSDFYINRTTLKRKNTLDFFSLDLSDSKVFEMFRLLRALNNENHDFISLSFENIEYNRVLESKREQGSVFELLLSRVSDDTRINIIDYCDQEEAIRKILNATDISYCFSSELSKDMPNLVIIKSAEEYKKTGEDDKHKLSKEFVVQNIIYSNFNEMTLKQCWLELIIKHEAVKKTIKTVDLKGSWLFYKLLNKKAHCLEVSDNRIRDIYSFNVPEPISDLLNSYKDRDPRYIVHNGKSLLILNTTIRMIPDWNKIVDNKDLFIDESNGKKRNKIRTHRNVLFGESIDVNTFSFEGKKYYSVGEIGYGMNRSISNSPATKEIIENGLTIEDCMFMMEPNIYQINKYAVYPYPYKLMDELFVLNGGQIDE